MSLRILVAVLLVVVGTFAVDEGDLREALEEALHVESVNVAPDHHQIKRAVEEEAGELEGHSVDKRSAEPSPDEFISYGDSLDEAKASALKMAKEMFGGEQRVYFR